MLVTGGAGFIGRHFIEHVLRYTDMRVHCVDRLEEPASVNRLCEGIYSLRDEGIDLARFSFEYHDLRGERAVPCPWPARYIVHFAAASHVVRSIREPLKFVHDNVVGTANLLEWARVCQPEAQLLYFSTDEVYGPAPADNPFREWEPFAPGNPYAATKAAADCLIPAWANTYGMNLQVTRCTNAYGPGQHEEKFIPLCIDRIKRDAVVQIHARGGVPSSRRYLHVRDIARAVMTVLERGSRVVQAPCSGAGAYNIAGDAEHSNLEVAHKIARLLGRELRFELCEAAADRPRHDQSYAIDDSKLRALGWSPRIDIDEGLGEIVR